MKKIKIITMTISKPDMFEDKVNSFIEDVEKNERVKKYTVDISFSGETLLGVIKMEMEKEDNYDNN